MDHSVRSVKNHWFKRNCQDRHWVGKSTLFFLKVYEPLMHGHYEASTVCPPHALLPSQRGTHRATLVAQAFQTVASPAPPPGHSRLGGKRWAGSLHLHPTWPGLGGGRPNCICRGLRVAGSEALHK